MAWVALLCVAGACASDPTEPRYEILPDMVDSVPYDSFDLNPNTRDRKTLLAAPPGSVPRGARPFLYGAGPEEAARAGRELESPIEATPEALARGELVYGRMCTPCHGRAGEGDGPVVPRFPAPPSLVAPHARAMPDGQIVHVITRGQGVMPAHGAQVALDDRWRIVHHIRKLQQAAAPAGAATGDTAPAGGTP
jgi:mono/diheme cytochrome c family protein